MWKHVYEIHILFCSCIFTNICSCSGALRAGRPLLKSVWDMGTQRGALSCVLVGGRSFDWPTFRRLNLYVWNSLPGKITVVIKDRSTAMNNAWFHKWMISVLSQKGPTSVKRRKRSYNYRFQAFNLRQDHKVHESLKPCEVHHNIL